MVIFTRVAISYQMKSALSVEAYVYYLPSIEL